MKKGILVRQTDIGADQKSSGRPWQGEKSPGAFRTITEVSNELELPQHVLRFWETKFPQIKPVKRRGGRRYYRPEDIVLIKGIKSLLYVEGYTIKGVQKLLRETGKSAAMESETENMEVSAKGGTSAQGNLSLKSPVQAELETTLQELEDLRALLSKITV